MFQWLMTPFGDQNGKYMKTFLIILIILAVIMFFTRPSVEKHKAAIADVVVESARKGGLDSRAVVCWDFEGKNAEFVAQAKASPEEAKKIAIDEVGKTLTVKDFWLCNVGSIVREGKTRHVSLGAFGHVFCTGLE